MRVLGISLLVIGISLTAATVLAQEGKTSFNLHSKSSGGSFVWAGEGQGGDNPTLVVPGNTEITIVARGDDSGVPHNIKVGAKAPSDMFQGKDGEVTYTFTSPASGTVQYVCTIHPDTMKGTVQVAGSAAEPGDNKSPGLGALGVIVAALGALVVLRRR